MVCSFSLIGDGIYRLASGQQHLVSTWNFTGHYTTDPTQFMKVLFRDAFVNHLLEIFLYEKC